MLFRSVQHLLGPFAQWTYSVKPLQYQDEVNPLSFDAFKWSATVDNPTPQDFTHYVQALKQLKELTTVSNPWIPVWSAVIGGLIASIPTGIGALYRARSTQKSVETAISAEIENIASMIRKRNYLKLLKEIRSELIEINNQIASVHDNDETPPNFCSRAITEIGRAHV